jgi:hypothetical protein
MEHINLQKEPPLDTLKINENDDGTFTLEWDPEDPKWSWMNDVSSDEISSIISNYLTQLNENESINFITTDDSLTAD